MIQTDVLIIGAGPVGLFAIFECGMMKLRCHVIDALEQVGGQCSALYPEKPIYDIPAHPSILAGDLVKALEQQAAPFNPVYHLGDRVETLQKNETTSSDYKWHVKSQKGQDIQAKIIIIAAGVGAFGPNKPPLPGLETFEDKSVHYFVRWKDTYQDKSIVIAGGGDSAVDWALSLCDVAKKVYVVHRRDKFRAAPDNVEKLRALHADGKIELVVPYQLTGLEGTNGQLAAVNVTSMDGQERSLAADYLLPFFGLSMNLGPIAEWGLNLDKSHITVNPTTAQTNEDSIFAIGDVATYDNKLKLILTGFAEAAAAAHKAREIVFPNDVFHFEYSTTSGVGFDKKAG